jgi:hypothetical protein
MIKEMYLFGACSLFVKKLPSFFVYRPEKEIFYFNKKGKFKFQKDLDCHGLRPLLNDRHLAEPPPFLLNTTFKWSFLLFQELFATKIPTAPSIRGPSVIKASHSLFHFLAY